MKITLSSAVSALGAAAKAKLSNPGAAGEPEEWGWQQFTSGIALERLSEPSDVANLVSFLAGPDGAWINAQVIRANGGII